MKQALLVNPHSAEEISDAIGTAIRISREEPLERWQKLQKINLEQDVRWWRQRFTDALMAAPVREPHAGRVSRERGYLR